MKFHFDPHLDISTVDNGKLITQFPHRHLSAAFQHLYQIDKSIFEKDQLKQVTISDNKNGIEIASKFLSTGQAANLPSGVFVQINQEAISLDIIKLTSPYLTVLMEASSAHTLICSQREQGSHLQRKYPDQGKERLPPGPDEGLKK